MKDHKNRRKKEIKIFYFGFICAFTLCAFLKKVDSVITN